MKNQINSFASNALGHCRFSSYKIFVKRWLSFSVLLLVLSLGAGGYWWYQWRDHSQDIPILAAARRYALTWHFHEAAQALTP